MTEESARLGSSHVHKFIHVAHHVAASTTRTPLHAVLTVAHAVTSTTLTSDDCERRRRCYPWPALKSSCYFPVAYVVASTALTSDDGSRCPCRYPYPTSKSSLLPRHNKS
ncbi:hypothetical protein BHM03_00041164 [Ensete ventricosum]|nr:hypothetical protein BHM03_00041164 [Ensete ventricosum]